MSRPRIIKHRTDPDRPARPAPPPWIAAGEDLADLFELVRRRRAVRAWRRAGWRVRRPVLRAD